MDRPPRVRPAVVAGAGAGASLLAAALTILALGAATVGYVTWPSDGRDVPESSVVVPEHEPPREPPPPLRESMPDRAARPEADERRVLAPSPVSAGSPVRRRARRVRSRRVPPARRAPVVRPAPVASPAPPAAPAPAPAPEPPTVLRGRVEEVARTTRELGAVAGRAVPPAEPVVTEVTDVAAETVESVAALLP